MAIILNGVDLRNQILNDLRMRVEKMPVQPKLAVVLVGDDKASKIYVRNKEKYAAITGIASEIIRFSKDESEQIIIRKIHELNNDNSITGILVQLPLPEHIDVQKILNSVSPDKDVDGFTDVNIGKMYGTGKDFIIPCTSRGILRLLDEYKINVDGKHVVVIGRSNIVGKPIAHMLMKKNATVTICHSHTQNISKFTQDADVIISATGKIKIMGKMLKPGCVLIDVGMQYDENGKLCGDCDFESCSRVADYITPTPGGVGPMTIAGLMMNIVDMVK